MFPLLHDILEISRTGGGAGTWEDYVDALWFRVYSIGSDMGIGALDSSRLHMDFWKLSKALNPKPELAGLLSVGI